MRLTRLCCLRWVAALLLAAAPLASHADDAPRGYAEQLARLLPAVVTIQTAATTPEGRTFFDGSGFVIDPSGVILTNRHVIADAYAISVTVPNIGQLDAKALYISGVLDVALLKVEAGQPLPALRIGDSNKVRIGDEVLLLGNPLGVGLSMSHGLISALNRDIGEGAYDHFFQTDAALNHGNSGGPMVNMQGEVIGINTGLISSPGNTGSVGIGFAMPINDALFVVDQYLHKGRVIAGTIGVQVQRMTNDLAAAFGMRRAHGLLVNAVDPTGSAFGLMQAGDVVLQVDGQDASDAREVARLVATTPAGQSLRVRLRRHGVEQEVNVPVRDEPTTPKSAATFLGRAPSNAFATPSDTGMILGPVTRSARVRLGLNADTKGILVTAIEPHTAAAERTIAAGDVILAVGDTTVADPDGVKQALQAAVANHLDYAALLIRNDRGSRWVALPLEADR